MFNSGNESLICEQEETSKYYRNAVSVMFDDCFSKNVVGHVPFNWSKLAAKFLKFPNQRACVVMTRMRVNLGSGFGLEIPVECIFYVDSRIKAWLWKS